MTISELRNRLRYVKHGGVPLPLLRSGIRSGTRGGTASGRVRGDLRITVRASPSGVPHPSSTLQPAGVPLDRTGATAEWGTPLVSFGAPPDDQMSITASEGELCLSGHDDSAALPLSGVIALSEPDPEMTAMLSWATENVGLMWNPLPRPDPSRLDEWFLSGGRAGSQTLSRAMPSSFWQHIGRLRRSNTSCAGGNLLLPLRLQTLSLLVAVGASMQQQPFTRRRHGASRRQDAQPVQAPAKPGGKRKCKRPWNGWPGDGGNCSSGDGVRTTPSWHIHAQSCKRLGAHRDLMLKHFSLLGLRVNWEKSKLVPTQRIRST